MNPTELQALSDEANDQLSRAADEAWIPGGAVMKIDAPDGVKIRVGCEPSDNESSDDNLPINAMVQRRKAHAPPPSSQEERRRARRSTSSKSKRAKKKAKMQFVPDP